MGIDWDELRSPRADYVGWIMSDVNLSIAQQLWQANQDIALACLNHPFVQGIGNGKLEREKFAYYVGQDAFFLQAFARAYSIAAAKAKDFQIFQIFHNLVGGVLQELELHHTYAQKWHVDLSKITPGNGTKRYIDFLLATAWSCDISLIAAAMCPCMRLYAFLGQELARNGIPQHNYTDWIQTYSSGDFDGLAESLEDLLERTSQLNHQHQNQQLDLLNSTYRYAMVCELEFFTSANDLI